MDMVFEDVRNNLKRILRMELAAVDEVKNMDELFILMWNMAQRRIHNCHSVKSDVKDMDYVQDVCMRITNDRMKAERL